ncbi:hypothetical protein [Vulcanisaeta sp. JCM 14467]|uniref:hypothetical protein n=1 Tax=Vulcanisaeta sp. JCM 14467 TaxID=1295370 RepID=UPI000A41112F|nr:hypothetical protein [Vulcanisaeta sp. JCM 14467]
MRKVQKNCLTLVVDVCNDSLDRFKGVMNMVIRRAGFGGAVRFSFISVRSLISISMLGN